MVQWRQVGCYTTFPAATDRGARTLLQRIRRKIRLSEDTLLVVLLLLVGSLAGLGAAAFQSIIALGPELWARAQVRLGSAVIVWLPAIGGLACGLLGHLAAQEGPSRGVSSIVETVALHDGRISLQPSLVRILSSIFTLLSGGSAGSADPNALIGAILGSSIGQRLHLSERSLTTLVASGTASGISAAFNAPIAGVFFAIEVVLDQPSAPVLGAVVLSSVVAALVNHTLRGEFPMFRVAPYTLSGPWELVSYVGLAIIASLLGPLYTLATTQVRSLFAGLPIPGPLKPALGGLAVGLTALWLPQLLGTGNPVIEAILGNPIGPSLLLLVALALLKPVFTSLTLGSAARAGSLRPRSLPEQHLGRHMPER